MAILYTKVNDVKVRLAGKVRFTDDSDTEPDKMNNALLKRLIAEAEGDVEQDLSPRYAAPFQTVDGEAFSNLPERPTKEYIRTMVELKSVMRVLETDFGSGTSINADEYMEKLQTRYDAMKDKQLEKRPNSFNQWFYPPLPSMRLNYFNEPADDGFAGRIFVTGQGDGDFPQKQINDPSENFWNGDIDDL